MCFRLAAVAGLVFAVSGISSGQQNNVYSKAVPPEKAALDRLNLRTEWSVVVPVEGNRDTLTQVQTIDDQVFVQTRAGFLFAIDARTGQVQWAAKLGNGSYGNSYPVAANANFVFCAHVTKLYAFYRYSGVTEFVAELGSPPTTGLAADDQSVYCVLGVRPGNAGAHRVAVYDMPRAITVNEPVKGPADSLAQGAKKADTNPVDDLLKRYSPGTFGASNDAFDPVVRPRILETPTGGYAGSKTPSLSVLPSVVPPYSLDNRAPAVSLNTLPSLRQPYKLRQESGKYIQQTPSLGVIPPSVAASLILSNLRPNAVEPPLRWEYGLTSRILYPTILTPTRAWVITDDNIILAINKRSEAGKVVTEVKERLTSLIAAPPAASGVTQYVPLGNGSLVAVEASSGNLEGGASVKWRAVPGGINNRTPFVTKTHVYAGSDGAGVVCLHRFDGPYKDEKAGGPAKAPEPKAGDPKPEPKEGDPKPGDPVNPEVQVRLRPREYYAGDIVWRADTSADRIIGANEEFVYVRDRQGRFLVYDAKRATDPARLKSGALGSANFSEFNLHVVNTASDRVYLAADNGLIVCLRDASAKYAKPMVVWPPAEVNRPKVVGVEAFNKDGTPSDPKKDMDPKKEPEKKP